MYLILIIAVIIIVAGLSYIMSNTGTPSNKEMDLVDLRIQKYKNQIEAMLKEKTQEPTTNRLIEDKSIENISKVDKSKVDKSKVDMSMEDELKAMVQASYYNNITATNEQIELSIEDLPLNVINKQASLPTVDNNTFTSFQLAT